MASLSAFNTSLQPLFTELYESGVHIKPVDLRNIFIRYEKDLSNDTNMFDRLRASEDIDEEIKESLKCARTIIIKHYADNNDNIKPIINSEYHQTYNILFPESE